MPTVTFKPSIRLALSLMEEAVYALEGNAQLQKEVKRAVRKIAKLNRKEIHENEIKQKPTRTAATGA